MRYLVVVTALLLGACRDTELPTRVAPAGLHHAPIGFVGDWVHTAPVWSRADFARF